MTHFRSFAIAATIGFASVAASASPLITVTPWLAPNAFGSPNFGTAQANAVQAMYQGLSTYGAAGTPGLFQAQSNVTTAQAIVTGFNSWLGQADPGTVFGAPFASELGNRMTFALRIDGAGAKIAIADLAFSATSTDPSNALAFGFGAGGYNYGPGYMGVLAGIDGIVGTGDDSFITSGSNTQLVDAIVGRGSGNSFAAYCVGCSIADQQAAINSAASYPGAAFTFTGTYTLGGASGSGTFNVEPVPEPTSIALVALALLGAVGATRRKA